MDNQWEENKRIVSGMNLPSTNASPKKQLPNILDRNIGEQ